MKLTDADRATMRAWLEDAFRICLWPAQLQENEPKFRETYRRLCELVEDGEIRRIEAKRYGSEGWMPVDPGECLHGDHGSCVSSSGNSLCGGYDGQVSEGGKEWVLCGEDLPSTVARRKP